MSNGLTVLEVPSSDAESVVVDFFVKTGSRSEAVHENGISHFLEHFLFKGTKKYPSALAISTLIDSIGGVMNANTGKEHTQYFIKAASQHLPLVFEVLTDMMQNPLFDPAELEREKGVIVEEINMYKDTPMAEVENVLEEAMWPGTALGRDIAGTPATVMKFSREMFSDYIRRHYQTPNIILGVSGKYDASKLDQLIQKHWAKVPKKKFSGWSKVKDTQAKARAVLSFKKTEQAHLVLAAKGLPYGDERNYVQAVMSAILGGGMSSRLFIEVRERRGLAYYVRAHGGNYQDTGLFGVSAGVKVDKIGEALSVIASELKKITQQPVSAAELKKAKEYIKGKTTLALEDNQTRLDWYLEQVAFEKEIISPQEFFRKIDRITPKQITTLARTLFNAKRLTLAVIGPYKKQEKEFLSRIK
ncbi:MAG: insulinase family protein [Patescibacteria group bacterium]|nr:insulinase family protein [Patescibacteria group bacterium]